MTKKGHTMKLRADRAELARAATWVGQAIRKQPHAPVLAGIRLTAKDGVLTLAAFDYDRAHSARVACEVGDAGECLVSGRFFREIVGSIKGKEVELALDGPRLVVAAGRSSYRIGVMRLEDYPTLPEFPAGAGTVHHDDLAAMVGTVEHAAARDDLVAILTAVHLRGDVGTLEASTTDRFRIARASADWSAHGEAASFTLNVPVGPVATALKDMSGPLEVGHDEGLFGLSDGTHTVTMRTLSEDFPALDRFFEIEPVGTCIVDAEDLAGALRRAAVLLDRDTALNVDLAPGEVRVTTDSDQGEALEVVECEADGEIAMKFNAAFLADALSAVGGTVRLEFTTPKALLAIHPADERSLAALVMPRKRLS